MNPELHQLLKERDDLVREIGKLELFVNEYTDKHDPRKWELLPVLSDSYSKLTKNQNDIEALFEPEIKNPFLKRIFKK